MTIDGEIKAGMRKLIGTEGQRVKFDEPHWEDDTEERVSQYGWSDADASYHVLGHNRYGDYGGPCEWVIPDGAVVKEVTYNQFVGTFTSNENEVGINAFGVSCKCGKYSDVVLRYTGSLGDAIQSIMGFDPTRQMTL